MLPDPTGDQLYDLTLIGLASMRKEKPGELVHKGMSVMRVMCAAGVISETVRNTARSNQGLIGRTMTSAQYAFGSRHDKVKLKRIIETSQMRLLVLVPGVCGSFTSKKLYTPEGYGLVITKVGMDYVDDIYSLYEEHISLTRFRQFWKPSM